jgi:hypothetical protein
MRMSAPGGLSEASRCPILYLLTVVLIGSAFPTQSQLLLKDPLPPSLNLDLPVPPLVARGLLLHAVQDLLLRSLTHRLMQDPNLQRLRHAQPPSGPGPVRYHLILPKAQYPLVMEALHDRNPRLANNPYPRLAQGQPPLQLALVHTAGLFPPLPQGRAPKCSVRVTVSGYFTGSGSPSRRCWCSS